MSEWPHWRISSLGFDLCVMLQWTSHRAEDGFGTHRENVAKRCVVACDTGCWAMTLCASAAASDADGSQVSVGAISIAGTPGLVFANVLGLKNCRVAPSVGHPRSVTDSARTICTLMDRPMGPSSCTGCVSRALILGMGHPANSPAGI